MFYKLQYLIIVFSIFICSSLSYCWIRTDFEEFAFIDAVEDGDGNFYFCGVIPTTTSEYWNEMLIIKTDAYGNELARNTIQYGNLWDIDLLSDDIIVACGTHYQDTTPCSRSFVALFDVDCDTIWTNEYYIFGDDQERSDTYNLFALDDTIFISSSNDMDRTKFAIVKIDLSGEIIWQKIFTMDFLTGVIPFIVNDDRSYTVLIGEYYGSKSSLFNLDIEGEIVCSTSYMPPDTTLYYHRIYKSSSDDYYLIGSRSPGILMWKEAAIAKIDGCGTHIWNKTIAASYTHVIAGWLFERESGDIDVFNYVYVYDDKDIFLNRCDSFGDTVWSILLEGDTLNPRINKVLLCNNGDYLLCGSWRTITEEMRGILMRIDSLGNSVPIDAIGEFNKPRSNQISAFPNPFNSSVRITVGQTFLSVPASEQAGMPILPCEIEIYDICGKCVAAGLASAQQQSERESRLHIWQPDETIASGVYLVRAKMEENTITKRIVYIK